MAGVREPPAQPFGVPHFPEHRVRMPLAAYRAIHLITGRDTTPVAGLMGFSPIGPRNESAKWHIIWCADILPQRRVLSGRRLAIRVRTDPRTIGSARVFIARQVSCNQRALSPQHVERHLSGKHADAGAVAEEHAMGHLTAASIRQPNIDGPHRDVLARFGAGLASDG